MEKRYFIPIYDSCGEFIQFIATDHYTFVDLYSTFQQKDLDVEIEEKEILGVHAVFLIMQ